MKPNVKTRQQLLDETARIAREIDQIFLDAEHWNRLHPNEEPINPDQDGVLGRVRAALTRTLESETP